LQNYKLLLSGISDLYTRFELKNNASTEMNIISDFPLKHSKYIFKGLPLKDKTFAEKPLEVYFYREIFDILFWFIVSYLLVLGAEKLIKKLSGNKKIEI